MRRAAIFALGMVGSFAAAAVLGVPPVAARGWGDAAAFGALADSVMNAGMTRLRVPGGVLVAVQDGEVLFARGYGFGDLERRVLVNPERTVFRLASVSKLVTSTAALQLVERGRIGLDADVNGYLERFQIRPAFGAPVTMFHLLTHTAGFDDRNVARKARSPAEVESLGAYLARRMPGRIHPPGRYLCYSNHGMALAGHVVEEVTGIPFERYVSDHVFAPLGMTRSSFALGPAGDDVALGYDDSDPPRRVPLEYVKTVPASMLSSTGADVARFMIAHLQKGRFGAGRILEERTAEAMQRRQFTQEPRLAGVAFGFWERFQNGERAVWHDGDGSGFASLLYLLPERNSGLFMAFNGSGGGTLREEMLAGLLDRFFPDERALAPPVPYAGAGAEAARAAGIYAFNRYGHLGMEKLVSLTSQVEARDSAGTLHFRGQRYVPIAAGVFRRVNGWGHLVIETDSRGRLRHLFGGESIARVYERMPAFAATRIQLAIAGAFAAIFLATLLAWPIGAIARRFRRGAPRPKPTGGAVPARILSAANLLFVLGLALFLMQFSSRLVYDVSPELIALFTLPLVGAVACLVLVRRCAGLWMRGGSAAGARIGYTFVAGAGIAFIVWLGQWNLLGYRF